MDIFPYSLYNVVMTKSQPDLHAKGNLEIQITPELHERIQNMGSVIEELRAEGEAKGKAEGEAKGKADALKALAKYLKKFPTKKEAIKQLMGVYGLSESEAEHTYAAA